LKLVALWLTEPPLRRSEEEQRWVDVVTATQREIVASEQFANEFRQIFNDHDAHGLPSWLARAQASDIPELKGFVAGIERDYDAVQAAVTQPWSNGQVEGQVHPNVRPEWVSAATQTSSAADWEFWWVALKAPPKVRKTLSGVRRGPAATPGG